MYQSTSTDRKINMSDRLNQLTLLSEMPIEWAMDDLPRRRLKSLPATQNASQKFLGGEGQNREVIGQFFVSRENKRIKLHKNCPGMIPPDPRKIGGGQK